MTTPRIRFTEGRHARYCHTCGKRLVHGEMIVIVSRRPRVVKTAMYRTTEQVKPLRYHDRCYEDGQ